MENKLFLLTRHDVMISMKNKNLNNYFCIIRHLEMLDYSFSEFAMIYSLYFFFLIIYLEDDKNKVYKSKDILGKINCSYKIPMNKSNIRILYSWESY